jgi:glycosyltransferase involved in cell wall biosynthesis
MKLLYVSRSNTGMPHQFVREQADVLIQKFNIEVEHFLIARGGIIGYYTATVRLYRFMKKKQIDIIHVHYGLWSFVVFLSRFLRLKKNKVIITFHGSDINKKMERRISLLGAYFSSHNILVSPKMAKFFQKKYSILPCGINTNVVLDLRNDARREKGWDVNDFVILFSSSFDRPVKDPEFAIEVIERFRSTINRRVQFIEMKGYNREQLTKLMQAADVLLMCSKTEGSPQVIKEAILNSLPVISNDVGDVKSICEGVDNCFIIPKTVGEYLKSLEFISQSSIRIQNRNPVIEKFDNTIICNKLYGIYTEVLNDF